MKHDCNIWPWLMMTMKPTYVEKSIPFVLQVRLDESQIDEGFKSLFRQLAGAVSMINRQQRFCAAQPYFDYFTIYLIIWDIMCVLTGHGDQCDWTADHIEQDHQKTLVFTLTFCWNLKPVFCIVFHSQSLLGKLYPFIMMSDECQIFVFSIFSLAHLTFSCQQIKISRQMASQKKPVAAWSTSWMYPQSLDVILCVIFNTLWA